MKDAQSISKIFKISSHEARLALLKALNEDDRTANDLSKLLKTTQVYTHRHLQILVEGDLVEKKERFFSISTIGKIFVNSLGWVEVISKYNDYWNGHNLSKFPDELLEGLYVLKNTRPIGPAPRIIDKLLEMVSNSKKQIMGVADRLPEIAINEILKTVEKQAELYALMGDTPSTRKLLNEEIEIPKNAKVRLTDVENMYMGILIVDDEEAGIIFPGKNGPLDWNHGIIGKDPDYIAWVKECFWEMYNKGNEFF